MSKVKQLAWDDKDEAPTPFGPFVLTQVDSDPRVWWMGHIPGGGWIQYDTKAEAKAAAQADFERRVFECLEGEQ